MDYAAGYKPNVQGEIAANRDNFVKGINAKVTSETQIKLGSHPGIEFFAESDSVLFRCRVYMVGTRPFMLVAGTYRGEENSANVNRFLSSFKLKP